MIDDPQTRLDQIRRGFGLDFITKNPGQPGNVSGAATTGSGSRQPASEENARAFQAGFGQALAAMGGIAVQILQILNGDANHQDRIYDLADKTRLDFDELLRVVEQLSKLGFVRYLQRDRRGNHAIQLTDDGQSLLR